MVKRPVHFIVPTHLVDLGMEIVVELAHVGALVQQILSFQLVVVNTDMLPVGPFTRRRIISCMAASLAIGPTAMLWSSHSSLRITLLLTLHLNLLLLLIVLAHEAHLGTIIAIVAREVLFDLNILCISRGTATVVAVATIFASF